MAEDTPNTKALQISLPPNEILINVVHALNGRVDNLTREVNVHTTCNKAISHVQSLLENHDRPLRLNQIRSRRQKQKLKELAQSANNPNQPLGPLRIRNAIPASQLPNPKRATLEERKVLKESFPKEAAMNKPFIMTRASLEDQKLATISGEITLSAIDGEETDPTVEIRNDNCLWDTGAQYCSISADLVTRIDPSFLDLEVHEQYRMHSHVGVQVDAVFSLSNKTFEISTIFLVLPSSDIPNKRTGIILGQHGFMDRMMVETIPRSILLKRGEQIEETVWGEIRIEAMLDLFEELQEFN
ncbi:MAG: uracil DNA glycosylase [Candelina submexicana]|nr:MAG: uracil DNA glycosylase [Candelina submexicana]